MIAFISSPSASACGCRQAAVEGGAVLDGREEDRGADAGGDERCELREAVGDEDEEGDEGDDRGRHREARAGEPEGERDDRQGGGRERLDDDGARRGGRGEDQRERHRGEGAEARRVVQGIREAAVDLDAGEELLGPSLREPAGLEAREDGDRADRGHSGGDAAEHEAPAALALRAEGQGEDAEVGRRRARARSRCARRTPSSRGRARSRARTRRGGRTSRARAGCRRRAAGRRPRSRRARSTRPRSRSRCARHVVAAVGEREVEDEDRGHQPGDESARVQAQLGDVAEAKRAQGLAVDGFHHH